MDPDAAYFDTSALIPLLIEEPGSATAARLWDDADHVVSVRLAYAAARAALAQAEQMGRFTTPDLTTLVGQVDSLDAATSLGISVARTA